MIKGQNTGSNNPPVKSKGDYHGKPHAHKKTERIPDTEPRGNPPHREERYPGTDKIR